MGDREEFFGGTFAAGQLGFKERTGFVTIGLRRAFELFELFKLVTSIELAGAEYPGTDSLNLGEGTLEIVRRVIVGEINGELHFKVLNQGTLLSQDLGIEV